MQPDDVPSEWRRFVREILAQGYALSSFKRNPGDKFERCVEVIVPKGVAVVKPDFSAGWHNHRVVAWSVMPAGKKGGQIIYATLGKGD